MFFKTRQVIIPPYQIDTIEMCFKFLMCLILNPLLRDPRAPYVFYERDRALADIKQQIKAINENAAKLSKCDGYSEKANGYIQKAALFFVLAEKLVAYRDSLPESIKAAYKDANEAAKSVEFKMPHISTCDCHKCVPTVVDYMHHSSLGNYPVDVASSVTQCKNEDCTCH